jgi:hypothetical protein
MKLEGRALLIFGSRTLDSYQVDEVIVEFLNRSEYSFIITALDPDGVCQRVKHVAKTRKSGVVLIEVGLDEKRAQGMHEARSIIALKMADHMLAIWDGKSKGTLNEIDLAEKMGVPTTVIKMKAWTEENGDLEELIKGLGEAT